MGGGETSRLKARDFSGEQKMKHWEKAMQRQVNCKWRELAENQSAWFTPLHCLSPALDLLLVRVSSSCSVPFRLLPTLHWAHYIADVFHQPGLNKWGESGLARGDNEGRCALEEQRR